LRQAGTRGRRKEGKEEARVHKLQIHEIYTTCGGDVWSRLALTKVKPARYNS